MRRFVSLVVVVCGAASAVHAIAASSWADEHGAPGFVVSFTEKETALIEPYDRHVNLNDEYPFGVLQCSAVIRVRTCAV